MTFQYDDAWTASPESRPLSLSLPMNLDGRPIRGEVVGYFFDNLLPDSEVIRRRVQARFGTLCADAFDLLEAVGRDCVGAIQLLPEGKEPEGVFTTQAEPIDEPAIERHLIAATSSPTPSEGVDDEFRISVAGAQEKTALTWHAGHWCLPRNATPTTHIFKLPLGLVGGRRMDMRTSLENEWLCSQIIAEYGVPAAACEIRRFGATRTLVVTRFDRALHPSGAYWMRLPQEDLCQATGTPSSAKYETDGGPGLVEVARILRSSTAREEDLSTLMRAQLLFWMLAAPDGHAKNFSIRLLAQGRYRLAPLYDVLSAWPVVGSRGNQIHPKKIKLAMALRGTKKHYRIAEVQRRHFNETARRCGLGPDMEPIIADVVTRTPAVIDKVGAALPAGFPEEVFSAITEGLRNAAHELEAMPAG